MFLTINIIVGVLFVQVAELIGKLEVQISGINSQGPGLARMLTDQIVRVVGVAVLARTALAGVIMLAAIIVGRNVVYIVIGARAALVVMAIAAGVQASTVITRHLLTLGLLLALAVFGFDPFSLNLF
jgi:hypothetical protein